MSYRQLDVAVGDEPGSIPCRFPPSTAPPRGKKERPFRTSKKQANGTARNLAPVRAASVNYVMEHGRFAALTCSMERETARMGQHGTEVDRENSANPWVLSSTTQNSSSLNTHGSLTPKAVS